MIQAPRLLAPRRRRVWAPGTPMRLALGGMVLLVIGVALLLLAIATASRGEGVGKPGEDVFWKATDYARVAPSAIALLPAVSFDRNTESEREVGVAWSASFARGSYRWISATTTRALLTGDAAGDSLLARTRAAVLKDSRVDSVTAPALCARLRVQALLSVRIDQWDRQAIELEKSGKPWSRVHLRATMVDSLGRMLWTASGSETLEGPERQPSGRAEIGSGNASRSEVGSGSVAPRSEFATGEGAPPPFHDVLTRILTRWSAAFPQRSAVPSGSTP